ncbi:hypothetical protein HAX54_012249 [Datura stramonium]|uniref:Uncharacterized protein n=1 Tax=Datura stramonium TaxID=4076 RepID=A0ABS8TJG3_DATST|nr:hypothetical protein [Datura stramonium]
MVDNNFTESFNYWILESRGKPILKMLEEIRVKIMNRLRKKEEEVKTWPIHYKHNPKCMELFIAYNTIANLDVDFNGDLGSWQLTDIPCVRAIKALKYKNIEPKDEISCTKEAYLKIYRAKLLSMRGDYHVMPLPGLPKRQYESYGPARELERDPVLRPHITSEELTRLELRKTRKIQSASRMISFRGMGVTGGGDTSYNDGGG